MKSETNLLNYNERSWAIDVISELNIASSKVNKPIKRASGELTLSFEKGSLFPDVLLYGDDSGTAVLQGWELKMPDTAITDQELIDNATNKAKRLSLNSFLLWNVKEAVLYIKKGNTFSPCKNWNTASIKTRKDVQLNAKEWKDLLSQILSDLNAFISTGNIALSSPEQVLNEFLYTDLINRFTDLQAEKIKDATSRNSDFEAELEMWFSENKLEFKGVNKYKALSSVHIINWINRFLFAHYLKFYNKNADIINHITSETSIEEGIEIFEKITSSCDFMNIFKTSIGQEEIDSYFWSALTKLNGLLVDLHFTEINQRSFHQIIDGALAYSRKKLAGQFSTPYNLAEYLVAITIKDRTKNVIDVSCGTGTIPKAAYQLKRSKGLNVHDALKTIWASDKFTFPLQLCSIALSDPQGMGEVIQTFKHDALFLCPNKKINFTNPFDGSDTVRTIPKMHAITSNLPFVRFEELVKLNPDINSVNKKLNAYYGDSLDKKADLFAYITLNLNKLVEVNGRIGIITSNSWLGASWGDKFKNLLLDNFNLLKVIVSGNGRWFSNADVVTTIIILEANPTNKNTTIPFMTTLKPVSKWDDNDKKTLILNTIQNRNVPNLLSVKEQTISNIHLFQQYGIAWNALFSNLDWFKTISSKLKPINKFFVVNRGERRGWDKMFYPTEIHEVEPEYIKPVLKSSRGLDGQLVVTANDQAFCCSETEYNLERSGKIGAINWIEKFRYGTNGTGKPLPETLKRGNQYWYEMNDSTLADIVVSMNPNKRLCFHKLERRSFVNQRLIRFTKLDDAHSIDLLHALMNSCVGIFLLEAIGFGRGLGALDINSTKLSNKYHILDPNLMSPNQEKEVLALFSKLKTRAVKDLPNELISKDRIEFDEKVLSTFNISQSRQQIYSSLLEVFNLRQTAHT